MLAEPTGIREKYAKAARSVSTENRRREGSEGALHFDETGEVLAKAGQAPLYSERDSGNHQDNCFGLFCNVLIHKPL